MSYFCCHQSPHWIVLSLFSLFASTTHFICCYYLYGYSSLCLCERCSSFLITSLSCIRFRRRLSSSCHQMIITWIKAQNLLNSMFCTFSTGSLTESLHCSIVDTVNFFTLTHTWVSPKTTAAGCLKLFHLAFLSQTILNLFPLLICRLINCLFILLKAVLSVILYRLCLDILAVLLYIARVYTATLCHPILLSYYLVHLPNLVDHYNFTSFSHLDKLHRAKCKDLHLISLCQKPTTVSLNINPPSQCFNFLQFHQLSLKTSLNSPILSPTVIFDTIPASVREKCVSISPNTNINDHSLSSAVFSKQFRNCHVNPTLKKPNLNKKEHIPSCHPIRQFSFFSI